MINKLNPYFAIVVAIPTILVCYYLIQTIEALKTSLPGWLVSNWGLVLVVGIVAATPLWWRCYQAITGHMHEARDRSAYRALLEAATLQAQLGYNLEFTNHKTGDVLRLTNPFPASALPRVSVQEEEPLALPSPQVTLPGVETLFLSSDYAIPVDDFLSGRKLIVGISGSGKSNTVGAYGEELGRLGVPFVLADTEDEYEPLCNPKWLKNGVLAGTGTSFPVTVDNAPQFGAYVLTKQLQVVLNLQSYGFEEAALVMVGIIQGMRKWEEALENELRIPCDFILEEAVTWLPQNVKESPLHGTGTFDLLQGTFFNDMVRKGRKRGLGLTLVCQKIAELDKRAMQSDGKIFHRQTEPADLERYSKFGITREESLSLGNGECFLFTGHVSKQRIQIRRRHSPHGANTPGIENLRRYQGQAENHEKNARNGETSWPTRNDSVAGTEPLRNISQFPVRAQKNGLEDVPDETKAAILDLYRQGEKRTDIQSQLSLNGDEYWMVKAICDEYDRVKGA